MTTSERKPRCMKWVADKRGTNRCQSEQVDGSDLCSKHLARAVEDYRAIINTHLFGEEAGE